VTRRLNWQQRQGPQDFDDTAPEVVHYDFDHRRNTTPGSSSWPDKFGPATIRKAWANGLVVYAEISGWPYPIAVKEARWCNQVLEVITTAGPRIAERLFTRDNVKGLMSTGELVE
jgi:hypothetical protein